MSESNVPVQAFPSLQPPNVANVDVSLLSNNQVRQNVTIADPNNPLGVAPVDPILGLTVNAIQSGIWSVQPVGTISIAGSTVTSLAAVTTGSPIYAPGTYQPLSLDTLGNLRVNVVAGGSGGSSGGSGGTVTQGNPAPGLTFSWLVSVNGNTISTLQSPASNPWMVSNLPGNTITVLQGTSPWVTSGGSSGGVTQVIAASPTGLTVTGITSGGTTQVIAATSNGLTVNGTVTANQGTIPWLVTNLAGNTITVVQPTAANLNATVTGSVSITGTPNVNVVSSVPNLTLTSIPAITGSVSITGTPTVTVSSVTSAVPVQAATTNGLTVNGAVTVSGTVNANLVSSSVQPVQAATSNGMTVTGTVTANQGGAPWTVNVVSSVPNLTLTSLPTLTATISGTPTVNVVSSVPNLTLTSLPAVTVNQGTPASFANAWPVVNLNGNTISVLGTGTDNTANSTQKLPVLPARANASAQSWTEGFMVPLSTDLTGALRVSGSSGGGVAQTQTRNSNNTWVDVGYFAGDAYLPVQVQNGLTFLTNPNITIGGLGPVNQGNPATGLTFSWLVSVNGNTITALSPTAANFNATVVQGTSPWVVSSSAAGNTPVFAATSNGLTINGTVNQGTPNTLANAWPVTVVGTTITVQQATAGNLNATVTGTVTSNQGTAASATLANAWPVNVVSSVPNLTLTSLPTVTINSPSVTQGTSPWVISSSTSLPVQAATSNGLTVTGTVTSNQGTTPWLVSNLVGNTITVVQSAAANLNATVTGTVAATQSGSWAVQQGTPPWTVQAPTTNGLTVNGSVSITGTPTVNVVSSVPNLTLTSLPTVTINTPTVNQGTAASATLANAWPVNVVSTVPNLTLTSLPALTTTITGTPTVNVVSTVPNLTLSSLPNVTVLQGTNPWLVNVTSSVPNLTLTSLPTLTTTISGTPNVNVVSSVPNLTLTSIPSITGSVSITGTPTVSVSSVTGILPVQAATSNGLTVTGTVTSNQGTSPWMVSNLVGNTISVLQSTPASQANAWPVQTVNGSTVTAFQPTGTNLHTVVDSGTVSITGTPTVSITSSVPNLTLTSLPNVTVLQGTSPWVVSSSAAGNTPVFAATANGITVTGTVAVTQSTIPWNVTVTSSVPNLTLTSLPTVTINTPTVNQGTAASATLANSWPVNVVSSVPNLTLTSLPTLTINSPSVTQGTNPWITSVTNNPDVQISGGTLTGISNTVTVAGSVTQGTSPWLVSNSSGNTITVLQPTGTNLHTVVDSGSISITGTPTVNVVSSVPNLTLTSLPTVTINSPSVTQGTSPWVVSATTALPVQAATSNGLTVNGAVTVSGTVNANLVSSSAQPVLAATTTGLTINGTITANQGTAASATLANAWPVNVVSSVPNLTLTALPNVTVLQGTSPWVTSGGTSSAVQAVQAATSNVLTINGSLSATFPAVQAVEAASLNGMTVIGSGTAGASAAGVVTVQGITNMFPVSVNVTSTVPNLTMTSLPTVTATGTVTASGNLSVYAATSNGLTINGTVNQGTPNTLANAWPVQVMNGITDTSSITGGSAAFTSTPMRLKATAGTITGWALGNNGLTNSWVKVFDTSSAPSVGSTVPTLRVFVPSYGGNNINIDGACFNSGIWVACVQNAIDSDSTDVTGHLTAGQVFFN